MTRSARRPRSNAEWRAALAGPHPSADAVDELAGFLRRGLARVLGDRRAVQEQDLDDFTQEALLRVLAGLSRFRGESRFTTWALAVATRSAFTELRRRRVRELHGAPLDELRDDTLASHATPAPDPSARLERDDLLDALARLIDSELSERQRLAVAAELAGLPTVAIAERLGTNANALYKLHHDARRKLRAALEREGFTPSEVRAQLAGGAP